MIFDIAKLNELLNIFGITIMYENNTISFIDNKTNYLMKPYYIEKENDKNKEKVSGDATEILDGFPFCLDADSRRYELDIKMEDDKFFVDSITRTEMKDPSVYEECSIKFNDTLFGLNEKIYKKEEGKENIILSDIRYAAREIDKVSSNSYLGLISVKDVQDETYYEMWFDQNILVSDNVNGMDKEKAMILIDYSRVFKSTIDVLCPKLFENYNNISKEETTTFNH